MSTDASIHRHPPGPEPGDGSRAGDADAVRLESVTKVYGKGARATRALDGVSVRVPEGSFTAVMGPSGSGKSTLLQCAAGLDTPTSGRTFLRDTELSTLNETELTKLRRSRVGFVFQAFNLMPALTVGENVHLPSRFAKIRADQSWVEEILDRVGLSARAGHRPSELSGGQQQRVAIARALATRPDVIFGDEPTGALDTVTAKGILALLRSCVDDSGQTVVMVTHDPVAASYAQTVLFLADGQIAGRMDEPTADEVAHRMTKLGAWA